MKPEERVAALEAKLEAADDALCTVLDIECGWCGPHAKRNWAIAKQAAEAGLEAIRAAEKKQSHKLPPLPKPSTKRSIHRRG